MGQLRRTLFRSVQARVMDVICTAEAKDLIIWRTSPVADPPAMVAASRTLCLLVTRFSVPSQCPVSRANVSQIMPMIFPALVVAVLMLFRTKVVLPWQRPSLLERQLWCANTLRMDIIQTESRALELH